MCLFARHQNVDLNLKGKYMPIDSIFLLDIQTFYVILSQYLFVPFFFLYSWKVLRVQKCHNVMQTEGGGDELGQSNGPSSTSLPEEQSDKNKIPETNDDDFDLDALAEALEQAATMASNPKKKNKSKHANAPVKRPVLKEQACDLSIPGEDNFETTRYHVCKTRVF